MVKEERQKAHDMLPGAGRFAGYWQVSQSLNRVSSVCMVPPEDDFSGGYHQETGRAR